MFDLTNHGMLDAMLLDLVTMRLKMPMYSYEYVWRRFIRT